MINLVIVIIGVVITALLIITEYLLCTKLRSPLWGGIIPVLLLFGSVFLFVSGIVPFEEEKIFPHAVLIALSLGEWITGREKYKKLKKAEMDKMRAKDL